MSDENQCRALVPVGRLRDRGDVEVATIYLSDGWTATVIGDQVSVRRSSWVLPRFLSALAKQPGSGVTCPS